MNTFLQRVAEHLTAKMGGQFDRLTVVFPNKRAGLFLTQAFDQLAPKTKWLPRFLTISELFQELSPLTLADPIEMVCRLHALYVQQCEEQGQAAESLDDFYSWGALMLSDFDDVDKCMADAQALFTNLTQLDDLTKNDFLTENQKEALAEFFANFKDAENATISIWKMLGALYKQLHKELTDNDLAYDGMLQREVVERMKKNASADAWQPLFSNGSAIAFVGFNVLNKTEESMMNLVKQSFPSSTYFYWDCSKAFTDKFGEEPAKYVLENAKRFGNALEETNKPLSEPKIRFVSAPLISAQASLAGKWVKKTLGVGSDSAVTDGQKFPQNQAAVVLCDETLLQPTLAAMPSGNCADGTPFSLNVTMGFPLSQTPINDLLTALIELQRYGFTSSGGCRFSWAEQVLQDPLISRVTRHESNKILNHLRAKKISFPTLQDFDAALADGEEHDLSAAEVLTLVFHQPKPDSTEAIVNYLYAVLNKLVNSRIPIHLSELDKESLFVMHTRVLNRLRRLCESGLLKVELNTFHRIFKQVVGQQTIPFHGEPATGMQVMGMLETRSLDFRHVIFLSANEGMLPKNERLTSFIPYILRQGYRLTTMEQREGLYAYYFYRLFQRAETVTVAYASNTAGTGKNEMSRYLMQMLINKDRFNINNESLSINNQVNTPATITVEKTQEVMERLIAKCTIAADRPEEAYRYFLSPSALKDFRACPLRFYLARVAKLRPQDEVTEEMGADIFGNIFHGVMETLYTRDKNGEPQTLPRTIDATFIGNISEGDIEKAVDDGFRREVFKMSDAEIAKSKPLHLNGDQQLNRQTIIYYVKRQLAFDQAICPITIYGCEVGDPKPGSTEECKNLELELPVKLPKGKEVTVRLGGIIDRIDQITLPDGTKQMRIVDYKTGIDKDCTHNKTKDVASLCNHENVNGTNNFFQACYYAYIYATKYSDTAIGTTLMYPANYTHEECKKSNFVGTIGKEPVTDFRAYAKEYGDALQGLLQELFDPAQPFAQTEDDMNCDYCNFKQLCQRKIEGEDA